MSTSDDPKEPYFFSVLPWIVLYHIIKHEEAAFDCVLQQRMSVVDDEGLFHVLPLFLWFWPEGFNAQSHFQMSQMLPSFPPRWHF